ncbi:hypothetical protein [Vibrio parahaemolyticus]|uniref:hypothetical protein n=1 Tax=Vibrio parahaemolyticus TaxID=670 RepID=UPI0008246344|nr:hypothetical protein [Vibrio parahaemolyticus]EHH2507426.1 hypothetical protein [Vibrio parahaemolyticus]EIZ1329993.1 hypothetical protein [Vibrio parahaemolyticus]EJB5625485.1 hypothetical protein [Vibrio parahaemolyticus]HAS6499138.1 hypothetical protein [Vibrio parahaemolyticus]HAS6519461.1 hypothetical protein [Vibrio parahaemolyticus]
MYNIKCALFLSLFFSSSALSSADCDNQVLSQFQNARHLFLTEESIHENGYSNEKVALWKQAVDQLNEKCITAIDIPFDRGVYPSDLYSLMSSYISGKGIEEWQSKFTLALICTESPSVCEPYMTKLPSQDDIELLINGMSN